MRPGRLALLLVTAAYVVALAWAALVLPERVPSHFDAAGRVDDWSSRTGTLVFWVAVGLVVLAGIPLLARLVSAGDGTWINMPQRSKDHWFAPERRAESSSSRAPRSARWLIAIGLMAVFCPGGRGRNQKW